MEPKRRINGQLLWKTPLFLLFGVFMLAVTAKAQILGIGPPSVGVQPVSTNAQNGDTVTFTTSGSTEDLGLGNMYSIAWVYSNGKNGSLPTNATVSTTGLGTTSASSTLTLTQVSSACAGTYYAKLTDDLLVNLLGLTTATATSQNATLGIVPTVTGLIGGSTMVPKGFKLQFSGPIGSNLVIQASSDMKHWTPISTNLITGGFVTYTDTAAATSPGRFYRAMLK